MVFVGVGNNCGVTSVGKAVAVKVKITVGVTVGMIIGVIVIGAWATRLVEGAFAWGLKRPTIKETSPIAISKAIKRRRYLVLR